MLEQKALSQNLLVLKYCSLAKNNFCILNIVGVHTLYWEFQGSDVWAGQTVTMETGPLKLNIFPHRESVPNLIAFYNCM